jgi:hypothetical protein
MNPVQGQVAYADVEKDQAHLVAGNPAWSTLCGLRVLGYGPLLPTSRADCPEQSAPWCTHCLASYPTL